MKILGAIFILCASICYSYLYEKKQKNRIALVSNMCEFVKYVENQIEYFCTPYNEILSEYSKNTNSKILFSSNSKESFLEKDEKKIFDSFFACIGKGFKSEEISLCKYTYSSLEKKLEKIKAEYPDKIKVSRSMSLFFGFSIIILLI